MLNSITYDSEFQTKLSSASLSDMQLLRKQVVQFLVLVLWTFAAEANGNNSIEFQQHGHAAGTTEKAGVRLSVLLITFDEAGHTFPMLSLGDALLSRGHEVSMFIAETVSDSLDSTASNVKSKCEQRGIKYQSAGKIAFTLPRSSSGLSDQVISLKQNAESFCGIRTLILDKLVSDHSHLLESIDVVVVDFVLTNVMEWMNSNTNLSVVTLTASLPISQALAPAWYYPTNGPPNPTFIHRVGWIFEDIFMNILMMTFKSLNCFPWRTPAGVYNPDLITTSFGLEYARPVYPMNHLVGPMALLSSGLSSSLQSWLDSRRAHSVVYFSMGSHTRLSADTTSTIVQAVMESGYALLWSLNDKYRGVLQNIDDAYLSNHSRILVSNWLPQASSLSHPSVAMAALHGGAGGVNEALLAGVPILCLPQCIDQPMWCGRVENHGLGVNLGRGDYLALSEVTQAIHKANVCRENAQKMSKIFKKAGGASKAVELIEYYHEVGYDHLVPAWAKYNWTFVQYYNLDVYCLVGVLVWIAVQAVRKAGKICRRKCARKTTKVD